MMQQLAQRHSFVATPLPVRAAAVSRCAPAAVPTAQMQHCRTDSATPGGLLHSPTAAPPPPPSPPAPAVSRFHTHVPVFRRAAGAHRVSALFGFGKGSSEKSEKELEKEEQFRKQQEVLARRRTNSWQAEVVDRRKEVSKYLQNPEYRKQVDAEKRARFKAKKEQEVGRLGWVVVARGVIGGLPAKCTGWHVGVKSWGLGGWQEGAADSMVPVLSARPPGSFAVPRTTCTGPHPRPASTLLASPACW